MKNLFTIIMLSMVLGYNALGQEFIPIDTSHFIIQAKSYVIENYKGKNAIYLQGGALEFKNVVFLNGTIEYDIFLKEEQAFPGVNFRYQDDQNNGEQFFIRAHLSGKPDANQAAPSTRGITPWQLYFGPKYSFPYDYKYDDWTHVKLLVNGDKAQVFLDYSETPQLSWTLFHETKKGKLYLSGGRFSGMHLANIKVSHSSPELKNLRTIERVGLENLIESWEISNMFEEKLLDRTEIIDSIFSTREWLGELKVEENTAVNISRKITLYNGKPGNTVFAKIEIDSDKDQLKVFEFGYSDRVVVILNGQPIYRGTNKWRSRDYRYLGTIGLFDSAYLPLKKGKNTLLMAVSEDFGGWLVTGRIADKSGIKIYEIE